MMLIRHDRNDTGKPLSQCQYWAAKGRGVEAMRLELARFEPVCRSCFGSRNAVVTNDFEAWLRDEKIKQDTECAHGPITLENHGAFQFAHVDATDKTISMMDLCRRVRDGTLCTQEAILQANAEWPKGRLICANCHWKETRERSKQKE